MTDLSVDFLTPDFLESWTATFPRGADEIQRLLWKRFGAPRVLPGHHVFGEAWLLATRAQEFRLTFHTELPDWAAPPVDTSARARTLIALMDTARSAPDVETLGRSVAFSDDCGLRPLPSDEGHLDIRLFPAMTAAELVGVEDFEGLIPWRYEPPPGAPIHAVPVPGGALNERFLRRPSAEGPMDMSIGCFCVAIWLTMDETVPRIRFDARR